MNIFYLDKSPKICAQYHCDIHSSKMCVEYPQMLSTAHRVLDGRLWYGENKSGRKLARYFLEDGYMNLTVYKAAHVNHPSSIWVRQSLENYMWLWETWYYLAREYKRRFSRDHASWVKLGKVLRNPPNNIPEGKFTQPTPAMKQYPECIVEGDSISSYRNFYWADKREFAKWTTRDEPGWWKQFKEQEVLH